MSTIPVFAGLGSELLFDASTRSQAVEDARQSNGDALLEACHQVFVDEVASAAAAGNACTIDADDFGQPAHMLAPSERYHRNPTVQHATLCLFQLLRYQAQNAQSLSTAAKDHAATSGHCVGLFAAVAVATARTSLEFLTRAVECFRVAVLLGFAVESAQKQVGPSNPGCPWSAIVKNIEEEELEKLIDGFTSTRTSDSSVYISCRTSKACFTISGSGDTLRDFTNTALPTSCTVRPINLFSLYHGGLHLEQCRDQIREYLRTQSVPFPSRCQLTCSIISTVDGGLIQPDENDSSPELLHAIIDMVLIKCTDWDAVQNGIVALAQQLRTTNPQMLTVCNYGPGYGALSRRADLNTTLRVEDMSRQAGHRDTHENDIAIVGMGIDLPDAPDAASLWQNLMDGRSSCSEIPADRFQVEDYYAKDGSKPLNAHRSMGTKFGNFLDDPFLFDHELFGVSPREAPSIDPQQRLILQAVHRALESAGYVPDSSPSFARESFGCFIGNATLDYVDNLRDSIDVYYSPGTLRAFLSGRISYAFKWSGPSITVDTACSSSLTAFHQAVRALAAGDCRAAVVGGVNTMTSPDMFLGLDKAHFLSQTGQCKSFDEAADGYCRSEGCVAFVIKRLSDAIQENDHILGVVKGTAVNQSGNSSSITHPHSPTQERLFRKLLADTGVRPLDVSVVEAHGTGTQAGDPNELRSIRETFSVGRTMDSPLYIGSIKANIGHCEAASGGASLAKLLLMLQHKQIPPQALLQQLNPAISELGTDGTVITTSAEPWLSKPGTKRTALLNNFGAAGSNAALLLQEYEAPLSEPTESRQTPTYVFGCSALSEERLQRLRSDLVDYLTAHQSDLTIADVCYTMTARRSLGKFRLSTTASSLEDLIAKLGQLEVSEATSEQPREIVFLFSGQGSQYVGMGRDLLQLSSKFRALVIRGHQLLVEWGMPSCMEVIQPEDPDAMEANSPHTLQAFQTGVFVLEVALAQLLIDFGIRPSMVTGHSLGEYAALVVAGVLDFDTGLWLVAQRARLIVGRCELWETSMLAVNMNAEHMRKELRQQNSFASLSISCENSESDCVVGGSSKVLAELKTYLSGQLKVRSTMLNVPVAYHTSALDPVLEDLRKCASRATLSSPRIPIASNVLARVVQPGEKVFGADYFAEHCRNTVAFDQGVCDILKQKTEFVSGHWIEIGPSSQLLPMVRARVPDSCADKHAALQKGRACSETLATVFSTSYCNADNSVCWRNIFDDLAAHPRLVDLPLSPMLQEKHVVPLPREVVRDHESATSSHSLPETPFTLVKYVVKANEDAATIYETPIHHLAWMIKGHVVCGQALCPGSVYTEMALAAAICANISDAKDDVFKISDISFTRPLIYTDGSSQAVRVTLRPDADDSSVQAFEIASTDGSNSDAKVHCTGRVKQQCASQVLGRFAHTEQALARRKGQFSNGDHQSFMTNIMYKIFGRVVDYSDAYRAVQKINMDENAEEVFAQCKLPPVSADTCFAGQPILLDTMLHVAGFAMNLNVDKDSVCICHSVHSTLLFRQITAGSAFEVHCSNFIDVSDPDNVTADAHAIDETGVIAVIKGMQFRRQKLAKIQAAFDFATHQHLSTKSDLSSTPAKAAPLTEEHLAAHEPEPVVSEDTTVVDSDDDEQPEDPEASIIHILFETTGVTPDKITPKTELAAIGVDSIMIFEIEHKMNDAFQRTFGAAALSACVTVADLERLAFGQNSAPAKPPRSKAPSPSHRSAPKAPPKNTTATGAVHKARPAGPPDQDTVRQNNEMTEPHVSTETIALLRTRLRLNQQPEQIQLTPSALAPLYLVHPGAGLCHEYYRIGALGRTVSALHDPRIFAAEKSEDWASLAEMAAQYTQIIETDLRQRNGHNSNADVILGGYSFGGTVAFEVARLLRARRGCVVRGVLLIDAPPPFTHTPLARETVEAAMSLKHGHKPSAAAAAPERAAFEEAVGALALRNNLRRAALLGRHRPTRDTAMPPVALLRAEDGFKIPGQTFSDNVWLHDRSAVETCTAEWEELVGAKVKCLDIPGHHFNPFDAENIDGTTAAVRQACNLFDDGL